MDLPPAHLPAAVLFDLDGTLLDSEDLWWEAECRVVAQWGGTWTREDQAHCLGGPLERVTTYMADKTGSPHTRPPSSPHRIAGCSTPCPTP